ncbi:MAG: hypothetical protein LRY41_02350 [Candidatus Pacebacteria bacterium]|nr:hypothetical protein [Candidatus Paceibacterota bacterium]MCD8563658.1 hypothetical protein [Candidatus Paceibacterota bacterium]
MHRRTQSLTLRIFFALLACVGVYFFPWWILGGVLLVGVILFDYYIELPIIALWYDTVYGSAASGFTLYFFVGALIIIASIPYLRKHLAFIS